MAASVSAAELEGSATPREGPTVPTKTPITNAADVAAVPGEGWSNDKTRGRESANPTVVAMVEQQFPGALAEGEFIEKLVILLEQNNVVVGDNSLLATSFCCDEVNRSLDSKLCEAFGGQNFSMGGLAGFPFGGVTSFGAFSHHIPKPGGSAVVVYAPHVGVDSTGVVGKVDRRGMPASGACCGSACAALNFCKEQLEKDQAEQFTPQVDFLDAQQAWVGQALLPHGKEVVDASNPMAQLPRALYTAQKEAMHKIITAAAPGNVPENTPLVLVGGIQINTPTGTPDFFLPLQCELRSPAGEVQADLLAELMDQNDTKWMSPERPNDTSETISG
eukprot:CAMPEP_0182526812 /NCGR_PEP_ID=MMETSP1323-20130603/3460_1 /TAXON_ID=236787 /ORGANISM="Florenciella parvula, Strain RCC1693" /LENGTH=332 /DNA_ID=CAMNT_0024735731 /DNA_START=28 /DNA_END=1026 /DNA_ORIENTATION=+